MSNDSVVSYVTEYMSNNGDKILDAVGRTYTADELSLKITDPNAPVAEQKFMSADAVADIYKI